jgi:hypothetical protein
VAELGIPFKLVRISHILLKDLFGDLSGVYIDDDEGF